MTAVPVATTNPPVGTTTPGDLWSPGIALPRYTPLRRLPEWEPHGRWMRDRPQLTWPDAAVPAGVSRHLLRVLLLIALVLAAVTSGHRPSELAWIVGLGVLSWGWLEWWLTWDLTPYPRRVLAVVVQYGLIAALMVVAPLAGVFGWSAYLICGSFFTGPVMLAAIAVFSLPMVGTQVGGWQNLVPAGTLSISLYLFDVLLGVVIITVANRREEAVLRRAATTRALLEAQAENAALQQRLVEQARDAGIRDERARLARELHDTVAQGLVAIVTQLEAATSGRDVELRVDRARQLARESLRDARRAVDALHPVELADRPLAEALQDLVGRWSARHEVAATVEVSGPAGVHVGDDAGTDADVDVHTDMDVDRQLLRICQEALSNVARHAGAARVVVSLSYADGEVVMDVGDDGHGFDPGSAPGPGRDGGHGLAGMAERARLAGGRLTVESEPGAGCVVSVTVPLPDRSGAPAGTGPDGSMPDGTVPDGTVPVRTVPVRPAPSTATATPTPTPTGRSGR
ncbi:sensor histidine kinase [Nakamurella endophytica]|uniref:Histidine kinase domain-containing protein n=1 Tax=Nakamurella endophytica TaxID=1748367 RepID=A0A917SMK2_9ACTN|nr:sensor histidine kinase [Nakamurella endophytica]GGL87694.1 hypothetical protein GCM10011594_04170 [Nakamurella endophytica]